MPLGVSSELPQGPEAGGQKPAPRKRLALQSEVQQLEPASRSAGFPSLLLARPSPGLCRAHLNAPWTPLQQALLST